MSFLLKIAFIFIIYPAVSQDVPVSEGVAKKETAQKISKAKAGELKNILRAIPVQAGGRIKPFDTFARESVKHIYGKRKSNYIHWVMTWILLPEDWLKKSFVWIEKSQVKKTLGFSEKESHFSPLEILKNKNF